jgi:hypothetical protein
MDELCIDALYRNTNNFKAEADQFNRFFRFADGRGINNTSGFRPKSRVGGATTSTECAFCVLVTNLGETEWPDAIDRETGSFIYYGDNRSPGKRINETRVGGNLLLERTYFLLHSGARSSIPPFLCFESFQGVDGMYMRFLGLAAPGATGVSGLEDLVAVWRTTDGARFQNYRGLLTILDAPIVKHAWLEDLVAGVAPADSRHCPNAWGRWVKSGRYDALRCERKVTAREKDEQLPHSDREWNVLRQVLEGLTDREFEFAAAAAIELMDRKYADVCVTRAVRDGGRDVVAKYRVGHDLHQVLLDVYIEAKRWDPESAVGVKPMMRLVSRIKHRDFGVFFTTSYFHKQVQDELIEDNHPILLMSGGDLARLLISKEIEGDALKTWLESVRQAAVHG